MSKIEPPTLDEDVRRQLRELNEPVTLFGEGPHERRARLRQLLQLQQQPARSVVVSKDDLEEEELFFTEGSPQLIDARNYIIDFSVTRAVARLREERLKDTNRFEEEEVSRQLCEELGRTLQVTASQVASDRPLTSVNSNPCDPTLIATTSWTPSVEVWRLPKCNSVCSLTSAHKSRINHCLWYDENRLFSAGCDGYIKLLRMPGEMVEEEHQPVEAVYEGAEDRVNKVVIHPSKRFVFASSHDETWRMWDIETQQELLLQEGHSTPVYGLALHADGGLIMSGDLGGHIRIWDLRSGRTVMTLSKHVKEIMDLAVNPLATNLLASGGGDNTVQVWDLRKQTTLETLLGHTKLVSSVQFEPIYGRFLVSSGYDRTIRMWAQNDDWKNFGSFIGHAAPITGLTCIDGTTFVTVSADRTFKTWCTGC